MTDDTQKQFEFEMGGETRKVTCDHSGVEFEVPVVKPASQVAIPSRALNELILAAEQMVAAYTPSRDNEWQYENGWGVTHRRDWSKDKAARERLGAAILQIRSPAETNPGRVMHDKTK